MDGSVKKTSVSKKKRALRVRKKLRGTSSKPRVSVIKSNKHISVQVIDDSKGITLASAATFAKEFRTTEFNKKNLTFVFPNFKDRQKDNYNFFTPYYLGCQFITMNYSEPNEWMKQYITNFKNCSFILKPFKLRYHPKVIKQPLDQTKKVSFAPRKVSTPFYSITY